MRYISCFLICFLLLGQFSYAQQPDDDWDSGWTREKEAFVVKQYHEFLERFNFDQKTPIVKFFKKKYPGYPLTRADLLKSLFNIEDEKWDKSIQESFISDVTNAEQEVQLDFYDDSWFAEVKCIFEFKKKQHAGSVILKLYHYENNSSKWQVVGIQEDFLPKAGIEGPFPISRDPTRILNPMSHAVDFASLYRAFRDVEGLPNYFAKEYWTPRMNLFFRELRKGSLCLEATTGVTYHLMQIDGWILRLNYYSRNLPNSGILISSLQQADTNDKAGYRRKQLNIK